MVISVMLAGIIGSASHCSVMCSPLVAAQMLELNDRKKPQSFILFYHAGRVLTYMILGALVLLAGRFVFGQQLAQLANLMMVAAGAVFIVSAILPKKTHRCCDSTKKSAMAKVVSLWPSLRGQYVLRGMLMGFMPCGLLVSALLMVGATNSVAAAMLMMFVFGLSTIPALQLAGFGVLSLGRRYPVWGVKLGRGIMVINGTVLCVLGLNVAGLH